MYGQTKLYGITATQGSAKRTKAVSPTLSNIYRSMTGRLGKSPSYKRIHYDEIILINIQIIHKPRPDEIVIEEGRRDLTLGDNVTRIRRTQKEQLLRGSRRRRTYGRN